MGGIVDCLNKVYSATHTRDLVSARYAAVEFAEFGIWLLRSIQGNQSDPKRFQKTIDELDILPPECQKPLESLLTSMDIDQLVEASEELAKILKSSLEREGVKSSIVKSVNEVKSYLRIISR